MVRNWKMVMLLAGLPVVGHGFEASQLSGANAQDSSLIDPSGASLAGTNTPSDIPPANETPADDASAPPPVAPEVKLSPTAAEIAKLAQSGVGDDVMLAYIGNVKSPSNLGSDQIVFLNDLGVSGAIVKAMIQRDAALNADSLAAVQAANAGAPPPDPDTNAPFPPAPDSSTPPSPMDNSVANDPTSVPNPFDYAPGDYATADDSGYFYNSLAPYGSWIYLSGYGVCWQPTVCLGHHGWKPYCDRGHWLYTDCGWYWQSDYSWAGRPFIMGVGFAMSTGAGFGRQTALGGLPG